MELQPLKIHFYLKQRGKSKVDYSLYMRLVLSKKRADVSLNYTLRKNEWNEKEQSLNRQHADRGFVLNLTNKYRQQVLDVYQQHIQRGIACNVNLIRQQLTGSGDNDAFNLTLLKLFERVIERKKKLAGRDNTKATIQKYGRCCSHLKQFIKFYYHTDDLKFNEINLQFVEDFELYLKTQGKCCHNTTMKHIQTFKTIYKHAAAHGFTDKDPFQKYKIRMEEVVRDYLTEREVQRMNELEFPAGRLTNVRDFFLFSCYTGLAYIDLKNLSVKNIQFENGKFWIRTRRQKTNVKTNVPLLTIPMQLIKKHCKDFESRDADDKIFGIMSNQKMNKYLKELATKCGIQKMLTFHIARHTFATTITLNNGVPIESVSSMLGHKHITTTQHYAKLLDKKLEADMDILSKKLAKL